MSTRQEIVARIREEKGEYEQTEILIEYIQELWETIDLLRREFSEERVQEIVDAPSPFLCLLED